MREKLTGYSFLRLCSSTLYGIVFVMGLGTSCSDSLPSLRGSGLNSVPAKVKEVESSALEGKIGFAFSVRFSDASKSPELAAKFGPAFKSLSEYIPEPIKANAVIISDKQCTDGETSQCIDASISGSSLTVSKFYEEESTTTNVVSFLDSEEVAANFSTSGEDYKVALVGITNMVNLDDDFADVYQDRFPEIYSSSKFYGMGPSKVIAEYCDEIAGATNFRPLAENTGGVNFNICQESWDEDFKTIARNLLSETTLYKTFTEEDEISEILSVKVGEEEQKFSFDEDTRVLSIKYSDLFSDGEYTDLSLAIEYK